MLAERTDAVARRRALVRRLTGLYALTPDDDDTSTLLANVRAALAGGARAIQYRHKTASASMRAAQASAIAALCREHDALFFVNDDPRLAHGVGADGVHIGEDDGALADARAIVGPQALVGVSCYASIDLARAAVAGGADYVAFGSLFPSTVKPDHVRAPLALLGEGRALRVPVVAIGGIDASNAARVIEAGADALAIITAVFGRRSPQDVEAAAAALSRIADAAARMGGTH